MVKKQDFDIIAAHKYFAVDCFNQAWDYIDKPTRTISEEDTMLQLSLASLWHWTQREDCTPTNLSIGYWQVSRVYALLRQADNARHYGELCLEASQKEGVPPYYRGVAYEALARAALVAGDPEKKEEFLNYAQGVAASLADPAEKQMLLGDLATIHQ
jgi:hypothetical protein